MEAIRNLTSSLSLSIVLYPDLFGALQNLLCGRSSQDGSVASWTELQAHGETRHQLDPQLCDGHFVIYHCDSLLCQDGV